MSSGLNNWVRKIEKVKSVSLVKTDLMPSGVSPVHPGPATMWHPASFPVVRLPM